MQGVGAELSVKNKKNCRNWKAHMSAYLNWPRNCGLRACSRAYRGLSGPGVQGYLLTPVKGRRSLQMGGSDVGRCQVCNKTQLKEAKFKIRAQT